ncbi:hypothetical protein A9Q81_25440 [Gammaproteobacteria bacterium 42_54_T18]|nr:hypothetical protein A9Q81_25440 [Gammaproteobacteria bacterium 42_54_T18]
MSYPLAIVAMDMLIAGESGLAHLDQAIYDGQSLVKTDKTIAVDEFVAFVNSLVKNGVTDNAQLSPQRVDLYLLGDESQYEGMFGDALSIGLNSSVVVDSFEAALVAGSERLATNENDCIVIASIHNVGIENAKSSVDGGESLLTTLAFDDNVCEGQVYAETHGAAAIVLMQSGFPKEVPHAYILSCASDDNVSAACAKSLGQADVESREIELIDCVSSLDSTGSISRAESAQQELIGLTEVYGQGSKNLDCALGSINTLVGQCGHVAGIASVIKSALGLFHRYIPMVPEWNAPSQPQVWNNSPFYVATESTPWFENKTYGIRKAAVNIVSENSATHIVLGENKSAVERQSEYFSRVSWCFYPLLGNNIEDLNAALQTLKLQVASEPDLKALAQDYFQNFQLQKNNVEYTLVILGESVEVLDKEVELMLAGLQASFDAGTERKTPKGSFFTPTPVGAEAEVAFVYPGIGAPYVDFGRDLFHLFPGAYSSLDQMSRDAGQSVKQELLYPRSRYRLDTNEKKQVEKELKVNLHKISECGVGMGYLLTKAFRDQFNFQPNAGVGYSMGEISMYVALDAWTDPGCLSEPLADHPTFKQNITGELFALKEYWGLSKSDESGTQLWNTYSLRGDPENVAKAVAKEDKVFLTIINTPDNMLIGGDPDACQRVVKALGTRAMSLQLASAIHSAPAKLEYDRIVDLYSIEVNERSNVRYYSTSVYKPVPHRSKAIAHSIAKSFTEQVDFPKLIGQMVDSGVRVFVEMGADRSCSTWIDKILKHNYVDMPHVCVPVNARGTDDHITIVRALAKLVSHQVDIDISSLFRPLEK